MDEGVQILDIYQILFKLIIIINFIIKIYNLLVFWVRKDSVTKWEL